MRYSSCRLGGGVLLDSSLMELQFPGIHAVVSRFTTHSHCQVMLRTWVQILSALSIVFCAVSWTEPSLQWHCAFSTIAHCVHLGTACTTCMAPSGALVLEHFLVFWFFFSSILHQTCISQEPQRFLTLSSTILALRIHVQLRR